MGTYILIYTFGICMYIWNQDTSCSDQLQLVAFRLQVLSTLRYIQNADVFRIQLHGGCRCDANLNECNCMQNLDTFRMQIYAKFRYIQNAGVFRIQIHLECKCIQNQDKFIIFQYLDYIHLEFRYVQKRKTLAYSVL